MKKLIALILVVSMGLMLCACGKSEEVKATEEAIKQIGEVNFRSGDLINNAEELFEALTPEEQATVKNADTLMDAVEAYDIMVLQPVDSYAQKVLALRAATNEFDLTSCFDLIENLRKEYDAMHPELREIMIASSEDDGGLVGMDTLADLENALLSCCVVNTFIAKPECVISIAGRGAWPIEESEIIYYNWWAVDEAGVEWAYNEYREYISKYAEIIDQGESFTFVNNNGDKVTVRFSSDSVLQVRAPR